MAEPEEKVRKLFSEKLNLDHSKIELDWAQRTGKPLSSSGKPQPIVVRFLQLNDKLAVLDKAKNWRDQASLSARTSLKLFDKEGKNYSQQWRPPQSEVILLIWDMTNLLSSHLPKTHHNKGKPSLSAWSISLQYHAFLQFFNHFSIHLLYIIFDIHYIFQWIWFGKPDL